MKGDDIIATALDRMKLAVDGDSDNRDLAYDDMANVIGEGQWPEDIRASREAEGRPCITSNRLPQFLRQVTGDLRNMNPAINVMPGDNESSDEIAELIEGLVRQIEYSSSASAIYEGAGESAAACGMGFFRVLTEYEDEDTFDQCIRIELIRNPFSVYCDPDAKEPTRADARYWFITDHMEIEDFKEAYPDKSAVDVDTDGKSDLMSYWVHGERVIVAEYFWREPVTKTISLMPDGRVVDGKAPGAVRTREASYNRIMWAKISGKDILEGPREFPGKHIPVIAVMGEEMHVGEKVYRSSVIRHAKDDQRMFNYMLSANTEAVALQPKAPFLVTAKQVAGLETFWNEANKANRPYLPYNPDEKAPGAPQRITPPVGSSGLVQSIAMAADGMKATTGIYDAGLGNRSSETSGVAIRQRQMESDVSTSVYSDNVGKAVEMCGRIIVGLIPHIYDTARVVRIVGKDSSEQVRQINMPVMTENGPAVMNDMTVGKYTVRVSVGPNYATRRQEVAQSMLDFIKAFPAAGQITADLVAQHMEWPGADQFAERLKSALPPGVGQKEDVDPQQMQQAQQQAAMQQQAAQIKFREEEAKAAKAVADARRAEADAVKAQAEAAEAQMRLAMVRSQITQPAAQPLY